MSLKVGLGHSENDLEIQGEIDFDFFDSRLSENGQTNEGEVKVPSPSKEHHEVLETRETGMGNPEPSTSKVTHLIESYSKRKSESHKKQNRHKQFFDSMQSEMGGESDSSQTLKDIEPSGHVKHYRKVIKTNVVIPRLDGKNQPSNPDSIPNAKIVTEQRSLSSESIFMDFSKTEEASSSGGTSSQSSSISMSDSDGESSISDGSFDGLTDSESITDVTPLNSPYFCDSPRPQSTCSRLMERPKRAKKFQTKSPEKEMDFLEDNNLTTESLARKKKDNVRFEDEIQADISSDQTNGPIDLNVLVAAIKKLEVQQNRFLDVSKSRNCSTPPIGPRARPLLQRASANKTRKNMSFSNDEVRRIDQENQRLLKKIVTQQSRQKPKVPFGLNCPVPVKGIYTPSSQVNRRRRQRQIEIENVAILKRIEAAKPSAELTRSNLLRDYNRLASGSPSLSRVSSRPSSSSQSLSPRNPDRNFCRSYSLSSLPTSNEPNNSSASFLQGRKKIDSPPIDSLGRQRNSQ